MTKVPGLGTSYLPTPELRRRAARVRLLVCDVDGVLTDGSLYFGPRGEALKKFHVHDGHGIVRALEAGLEVAFLTRRHAPLVRHRARELGVRHCILASKDKARALRELQSRLGIGPDRTAYVGDDEGDRPCGARAALFFTPADGWLAIQDGVHVKLERGGGAGAVRQLIEFLLAART